MSRVGGRSSVRANNDPAHDRPVEDDVKDVSDISLVDDVLALHIFDSVRRLDDLVVCSEGEFIRRAELFGVRGCALGDCEENQNESN